ncbi:IclR family transcriptional regulator [Paraburkholderia sp. BL17N1]|uniref:IclR family transcriptional regulator n=1 Tax=Paraburkholderia sp. BL17N1 TaxID=1938798 RepID=UPI000EAFA1E7|nr:IclR family transcriptional regulator [Paraburkholderia sp. BL17N1]RKR31235.1 IclR family transcriptional regulator [Paraburkholderia sp. BL17N1]
MRVVKGAVDRSLQAIELLAREARWMRMSDIAAELELEKGPAHRVLAQLCEQGWAEQDEQTSQYRLTLKLSLLGQRYLHGLGLPGLVQPILDGVAAQCRELVRLTVVNEGTLAWLASSQGAAPGLMYSPSMDKPIVLHATANGKVWLATMSNDEAIEHALRGGLGKPAASGVYAPKAISSVEQLIPELERTRHRGYGLVVEEAEPGVVALAVPVRSLIDGAVVGTMSIAGPVMRVQPDRYEAFYALLQEATEKLGAVWPRQSVGSHASEAA